MAQVTNITCDQCGKILHGKDKAAYVSLPNIQINGQIVLQKIHPVTGRSYPIFVTRTNSERMNFCDLVCLQDHVDFKEGQYDKYQMDALKKEASQAAINQGASRP